MRSLTPQGNRILIKRLDEDRLTSSIIEVVHVDETKESQFALVLAVGSRVVEVKPLMTVVTKKYCGTPLSLELVEGQPKEQCYLVMEDDILGKFV